MVAAAIDLEFFMTVTSVGDVWAGVWTGTVLMLGIDVTIVTRVGVVVGVSVDLLEDTMIVFVADIGVDVLAGVNANMLTAAMADIDFIDMRGPLDDSLFFGCC